MNVTQVLLLLIAGSIVVAVTLGVLGLRFRPMRYVLAGLAPLYSAALFVYAMFRGGPNECVTYPGPPGYICHPTSYLSDIGWYGLFVVLAVTAISFAPLIGARIRSRTPAVLGVVVLTALIAIYLLGLLNWVPADAAMLAAAIGGPPRPREPRAGAESVT